MNPRGDLLQEGQITAVICFQKAKAICLNRARRKHLGVVVCSPGILDLSVMSPHLDLPDTVPSTKGVYIQYDLGGGKKENPQTQLSLHQPKDRH